MTTKITPFTILNKQMTQINTAERLAAKAFFGLFYKVTTNCNPTKPYNKSLIKLVCSSVRESIAFGFYRTDLAPSSLVLHEKPQAIHSSHQFCDLVKTNKYNTFFISCTYFVMESLISKPVCPRCSMHPATMIYH